MKNKLYFLHLYFSFLSTGSCTTIEGNIYKAKKYSFINFGKEMFDKKLNASLLKTVSVKSELDCQMECVIHELCLSYNFGPPRQGTGYCCELSSADRFSKREHLKAAAGFVHRGVGSVCEKQSPCGDKGFCIPVYDENAARCECFPGNGGIPCVQIWKPLTGLLTQIDAGATGALWGINGQQYIFKLNGDGTDWKHVDDGARLQQISVGEGGVCGVGLNDLPWYRKGSFGNKLGSTWVRIMIDRGIKQITCGPFGVVFGVNSDNKCYYRTGITKSDPKGTNWQYHSSGIGYISCGAFGCWGIKSTATSEVFLATGVRKENLAGSSWVHVSGKSFKQIDSGLNGAVWGVTSSNEIFYRANVTAARPTGTDWVHVQGNMTHVTVGCDGVYGVDTQHKIYRYTGEDHKNTPCL